MNIFYVSRNPSEAARSLGDQHVLKMILESAQLLDTARHESVVRRPASVFNHPCARWVRQSRAHYVWLYNHFIALLDEYTHRFGKAHAYEKYAAYLANATDVPNARWEDPPLVMPLLYHFKGVDKVEAYRNYYALGKGHLHRFTNREAPKWIGSIRSEANL